MSDEKPAERQKVIPSYRPVEHWAEQADPATEAASAAREALRLQLRAVATMIRYADYADTLTADLFYKLVRVALLDCFFSWTDREKADQLGISEADLEWGRDRPEYETVCSDARARLGIFKSKLGIDGLAEAFEDQAGIEAALTTLLAPLPKDRIAASAAFLDRRSAKKTRDEGGRAMLLPDGFLELIEAARGMIDEQRQKRLTSGPDPIEISAIHVPMPEEPEDD